MYFTSEGDKASKWRFIPEGCDVTNQGLVAIGQGQPFPAAAFYTAAMA